MDTVYCYILLRLFGATGKNRIKLVRAFETVSYRHACSRFESKTSREVINQYKNLINYTQICAVTLTFRRLDCNDKLGKIDLENLGKTTILVIVNECDGECR